MSKPAFNTFAVSEFDTARYVCCYQHTRLSIVVSVMTTCSRKGGRDGRVTHEIHVTRVMDLPRIPIPSIHQNAIPRLRLDCLGILDRLPRQLREGLALHQGATLHLAETILLRVTCVPDPVDEQVGGVEEGEGEGIPMVFRGGVVGQVDGAVAVRERDPGQIPEDEHEAPLLVVHVPDEYSSQDCPLRPERGHDSPRSDDTLLALGASIGIEEVR